MDVKTIKLRLGTMKTKSRNVFTRPNSFKQMENKRIKGKMFIIVKKKKREKIIINVDINTLNQPSENAPSRAVSFKLQKKREKKKG